jgi:glycine cleavage system aminomethyltransferase T
MALPRRYIELDVVPVAQAAQRIRRCTYRRLSRVEITGEQGYEVSCLFPDRRLPLPLGDLDSSAAICGACEADHVFRPDED